MKLIMVDLDGTLFDTREVNYRAYKEAVESFGFSIDYEYYSKYCNGRHFMDFLPQSTTTDEKVLSQMHRIKKAAYEKYLEYARLNEGLLGILKLCKCKANIALVTTASADNTSDILRKFGLEGFFDVVLTHEDIHKSKPDPEGFLKAMDTFGATAKECVIFEDSDVGILAAEKTGATVFVVKGFN